MLLANERYHAKYVHQINLGGWCSALQQAAQSDRQFGGEVIIEALIHLIAPEYDLQGLDEGAITFRLILVQLGTIRLHQVY